MPWTMTLDSEFRKIAMVSRPSARCQLSGAASRTVHSVHLLQPRQVCGSKDLAAQLSVVAVQPCHKRYVDVLLTAGQELESLHDPIGHRVACGDAAKHVHKDALYLIITDDDLQAVGHDLCAGSATDIEEVGRLR